MMITKFTMNVVLLFVLTFFCWSGKLTIAASVQIDPIIAQRSVASLGLVGDSADVNGTTVGGTVLAGGGRDVDEVFQWMIKKAGGGDFVVLRATGTDAYNSYIYDLGPINSVETLLINSRILANDPEVERTILNAEAVFISGGDQANYVNFWKDTKVHYALDYLRNVKQIPMGGTSAGCAILGGTYFSALIDTITSPEALNNPYIRYLTLGYNDFLKQPFLSDVVTDTHFDNRDRHGRLTTFLARMSHDNGILARGIGVDEAAAVCIEPNGIGKIYGSGNVYFLSQNGIDSTPETCLNGSRLDWYRNQRAVRVYKIKGTSDGASIFDLNTWAYGTGGNHLYYYVRGGILHITS
jgi:cyanophycinase